MGKSKHIHIKDCKYCKEFFKTESKYNRVCPICHIENYAKGRILAKENLIRGNRCISIRTLLKV